MSNIHKPSGEQSIVAVFHHQPKYKYRITAKYDNFPQSIIYRSTKTAHELMQGFLSDIRHGKPCFICDADDKYGILNLGKANVIEIDILEE
jgi:hypothetical protein